jgi:hypothetical protein
MSEWQIELDVTLTYAGPLATWQAEVRLRGEQASHTFTSVPAWLDFLRQVAAQPAVARSGLR